MTPGTPFVLRPAQLIAGLTVSTLLFSGLGFVVAPAAFAAEGPCVGDTCDDGAWLAARGVANDQSYWGMYAGHNCTNYAAWRLITDGVKRPATNPGAAADWATNAGLDGYLVDNVPEVGAIAQWDAYAGGYGERGHVAYVEHVNADGTILVSEDYWRDGAQTGPLTYRVVAPASVSHFIHYGQQGTWLRTSSRVEDRWSTKGTGLDIRPSAITGTALTPSPLTGDTLSQRFVELFFAQDGDLWQATRDSTGWTASDSGVASQATSLSAVSMDGVRPYVMSLDGGDLVMSVRTATGWQRMRTGIPISGEVSAVNLGGLWPTVFLSQDGTLQRIWGDTDGWHSESTGVEVWGSIAAVVTGDGWPVVFNARNGFLFRSWQDESGWHTESTGVSADGSIAAVQTAAGVQVYLLEGDVVSSITTDGTSWTKTATDLDAGTVLTVIDLGEAEPLVAQVG